MLKSHRCWSCARLIAAIALLCAAINHSAKADDQATSADGLAATIQTEYENLAAEAEPYKEFAKDDLAKAKTCYDEIVASLKKEAEAWRKEDGDAARAAHDEAFKQMSAKDAWRRRIGESRRLQAEAAPTQRWSEETSGRTPADATAAFDALVAAKKAESEAWAAVAEATVADAEKAGLVKLREAALGARNEMEIATWKHIWACRQEEIWKDKNIKPEDVEPALKEMQALQDKRAELHRERFLNEQKVRQAEADLSEASHAFLVKYSQVQQARAQAVQQ